jgi:peroxiredoxin
MNLPSEGTIRSACMKTFILLTFLLLSGVQARNASLFISPSPASVTVYLFLSENCPICQSYTVTLKTLYGKYKSNAVTFVGVFSNYWSTLKSVHAFGEKYSIPFQLITDPGGLLAKRMGATISPEVFVENNSGELIYSGRIDNAFYELGKRKNTIISTELADVLEQLSTNKTVTVKKTEAVGCVLSLSK